MWACLALWPPLTAPLLPGDSCTPAMGLGLFMWEILLQIRNKHVKDCSHISLFGFQEQSFLSTALHTKFLVPISTDLKAAIANFAFLTQHPVNSFFLLSLLTIFIISAGVIQSDPCCVKFFANIQKDSFTSYSSLCPEPRVVTNFSWAAFPTSKECLGMERTTSPLTAPSPSTSIQRKQEGQCSVVRTKYILDREV